MADSKQIAGLIGPTMMALTVSEALNLHVWDDNSAPVTYLNGTLLFVAGLSIVRAHNRWGDGWPVMVTIAGWVALLGGMIRMFAPDAQQARQNGFTYVVLAMLFAVGTFLTCKAFHKGTTTWPGESERNPRR